MNNRAVEFAAHAIADRIGLSARGRIVPHVEGAFCELIPSDGHPNETFVVRLRLGWRSAEASFVAGSFAGPLISSMGNCSVEARLVFTTFAVGLETRKVQVVMRVNGAEVKAGEPSTWPEDWSLLELSLRRTPLVIDTSNEAQMERLILDLVVPLFGMLATLIGVEENELLTTGETEGRATQSISTRYERKKVNREACIQLKGAVCSVCRFDFAETYGHLGLGFIEIHHVTPISSLDAEHHLDVATDLEPLCSNCHAMAHREEPPVSIKKLREIVQERRRLTPT